MIVIRTCGCWLLLIAAASSSLTSTSFSQMGLSDFHHPLTSPVAFVFPRPLAFRGFLRTSAIACTTQQSEDSEECPGGVCKWEPPSSPDIRIRKQAMLSPSSKDTKSPSAFESRIAGNSWLMPTHQLPKITGERKQMHEGFPAPTTTQAWKYMKAKN